MSSHAPKKPAKKAPKTQEKQREAYVSGVKASLRMDRPGRKMGGRCGADMNPLSTAARNID